MTLKPESRTKRDDILEVAVKLFYEQGYNQTGIQQIIHEAGTAKGTFYTFFKSKEELGVAWLRVRHHTWNKWLSDFIAKKSTSKSKLLGIFEFLGSWMKDCDYQGCAFLNTLGEIPHLESPLRNEITDHKRELHELFISLVEKHHHDKPKTEQIQIASTLFLLFEGTITHMKISRSSWPLEVALKEARSLL